MSFGDETNEAHGVLIQFARRPRLGPEPRQCPNCGDETTEPGERCKLCRSAQGCVSASFVQSTVADAIARLDKLRLEDAPSPMVLPLQRALRDMRRTFDTLEPLIDSLHVGVVRVDAVTDEFWAFPYPMVGQERLGPFGKRRHAERALVEHALEHGAWDTGDEIR